MLQSQALRSSNEQRGLEREAKFPKDSVVRLKPDAAARYKAASTLKDRIGRVQGHQLFARHPIILFPAIGRRPEFRFVATYSLEELEIVTDAVELSAWETAVAEKAEKLAKKEAASGKKVLKTKVVRRSASETL